MKSRRWLITFFALAALGLVLPRANAQTPGVLYTWPTGTQDWFKNFGAGSTSATLANSGGALQITETSATQVEAKPLRTASIQFAMLLLCSAPAAAAASI